MGKITIKYFFKNNWTAAEIDNICGSERPLINDDETVLYPLYIKITYLRSTTQFKSIIEDYYTDIKEVEIKRKDLMEKEAKMVEDVINKHFRKEDLLKMGEKVSLKGLSDYCKKYSQSISEFFTTTYLQENFNKVILNTRSPFMRFLTTTFDFPKIDTMIYYEASVKLIGEKPEILALKERFINHALFRKAISKSDVGNMKVIDWVYGNAKEKFSQRALEAGLTFDEVFKLVPIIDNHFKNTL